MTADTQNELPQPTRSNADFWKVANSKLIRYGGQWSPVRIVRAKGTVMWVSCFPQQS
jgi:hypothetical protein